jgi:hypothetical protein
MPRSVRSSSGWPGRTPAGAVSGSRASFASSGSASERRRSAPRSGVRDSVPPRGGRARAGPSSSGCRRTGSSPVTSSPLRPPGSGRWARYVLVSIELGSRRIHLSAATAHPDSAWVTPQARNLVMDLDGHSPAIRFVIRDRDAKFCGLFDTVLRAEGMRVIRTPIRAPNANAHAERRDRDDPDRVPRLDAHPEVGGISIERFGPTPSTTTAGAPIAPSASPLHEPKPRSPSRSRSARAMFAGRTCSVDSSTSTTASRRDRIWVSDPHGVGRFGGRRSGGALWRPAPDA